MDAYSDKCGDFAINAKRERIDIYYSYYEAKTAIFGTSYKKRQIPFTETYYSGKNNG